MKKKTKIIIGAVALVVVAAGMFLAKYLISVQNYQNAVSAMRLEHKDASGIADGIYTGECDVDFIYAKVQVEVVDERIASIDLLEHRHGRGAAAEGIEQKIVEEQKLDVETVSGATNSSQTIKKAVDNALSQADVK